METITKQLRNKILIRDKYKCVYCKRTLTIENVQVDHIYPKKHGGLNIPTNLASACLKCNLKKSDNILDNPPKVKDLELENGDIIVTEPSKFAELIRISKENNQWIKDNKGKKSSAGFLDKIINDYRLSKSNSDLILICQETQKHQERDL